MFKIEYKINRKSIDLNSIEMYKTFKSTIKSNSN